MSVSFVDVMEAMVGASVEVNARVSDNKNLNGMALLVLSDDFDINMYNEALKVMQTHKEHFTYSPDQTMA